MFDAIEAADWTAIPGFAKFYEPATIAPALRKLAAATAPAQAAEAAAPLFSHGLIHSHSAGVHPASVTATPILLEIIGHAHPATHSAALGLITEAMTGYPYTGFTTVATVDGPDIPLCCAVAHLTRSSQAVLSALGRPGKNLLSITDEHWRFTIAETASGPTPASALVTGTLEGRPRLPAGQFDIRHPLQPALRLQGAITSMEPATRQAEQVYLTIDGVGPEQLPPRTTLWAPCTDRVH